MSEPENFLARWSRKKQSADREEEAALPADTRKPENALDGAQEINPPEENPETAFDLSKLPSIDSITAGSDVRAFLQKGVPAELTRAALRRAWTSDPAIRDFIEVAENQWDFATGSDIPGFGPLEPSEQLRQMVDSMFQAPPETSKPEETAKLDEENGGGGRMEEAAVSETKTEKDEPSVVVEIKPSDARDFVAAQHEIWEKIDSIPTRKRHGSALPE